MDNNTRLKVLIKSISPEQSFQKSYHSITNDRMIHLNNLCTDSHMNDTHLVFLCLTNSMQFSRLPLVSKLPPIKK